jgi:hypothetical protein
MVLVEEIKTNAPRPRNRRRRARARQNTAVVVRNQQRVRARNRPRANPRRRGTAGTNFRKAVSNKSIVGGPITKQYISMLTDPFDNPPVRVGFGTLSDTELVTAFFRATRIASSTENEYLFILNPHCCLNTNTVGNGSPITSRLNYFLTVNPGLNGVAVGTNAVGYAASNITQLTASLDTARPIASSIRVAVAYPETSVSPFANLLRLNGIPLVTSLDTLTGTSCANYPEATVIPSKNGGTKYQLNWLPSDVSDFVFHIATATSNGSAFNPLILSVTGLPSGSVVFVEAAVHCEGQQGIDIASALAYEGTKTSLVNEWPSLERMWGGIKGAVTTVNSIMEIDWETGMKQANRALKFMNPRQITGRRLLMPSANIQLMPDLESKHGSDSEEYEGVHHCEFTKCNVLVPDDVRYCSKHRYPSRAEHFSAKQKLESEPGPIATSTSSLPLSASTVGVLQTMINSYKNVNNCN